MNAGVRESKPGDPRFVRSWEIMVPGELDCDFSFVMSLPDPRAGTTMPFTAPMRFAEMTRVSVLLYQADPDPVCNSRLEVYLDHPLSGHRKAWAETSFETRRPYHKDSRLPWRIGEWLRAMLRVADLELPFMVEAPVRGDKAEVMAKLEKPSADDELLNARLVELCRRFWLEHDPDAHAMAQVAVAAEFVEDVLGAFVADEVRAFNFNEGFQEEPA